MQPRTLTIALSLMLGLISTLVQAQTQFQKRPTAYSSNCAFAYINPPNAYDDNFSTASYQTVGSGGKGGKVACEYWFGFPSAPSGATGMQLNIDSSGLVTSGMGSLGGVNLFYSLDGGNSYTSIYFFYGNGSFGPQTNTISLSNSQDLTKIKVQAKIETASDGSGASATQNIIEIWVSGTEN